MIKYIEKTLVYAYLAIFFYLVGKILISESEASIKIICLSIMLTLFLISLGSYSSWRHMKQIVEHKNKVNILFAIHLMSYLIIAHSYYHMISVQVENIYFKVYLEQIAIYVILATNFMPMLYLGNLRFKYFKFNGKTFIKREKPLN